MVKEAIWQYMAIHGNTVKIKVEKSGRKNSWEHGFSQGM
jgi:hypothetical protein